MELVALLSSGENTWAQVSGLITHGDWEKIILVGGEDVKSFTHEKKFEFIKIDLTKRLKDLQEEFSKNLKNKFEGMEVALSIASGNGKEHMALISALINLPIGIRFAALTKKGVIDL
jgi:ERCC4-related helicase